ncbi:MAG TPA: OmpA family protein [Rhodocyclaceae bacterium]|nr:OmpA family protein [Rhodocyclaceae bacterium]
MKPRLTFALAGAAVAAGCASTPPAQNLALQDARTTYQAVSAETEVQQAAPVELSDAAANLHRAEAAWQNGGDPVTVNHLAYLANQQALIAREKAGLAEAEHTIQSASAERSQVLLEAKQQALTGEREKLALAQRRAQAAEGVAAAQAEKNAQLQQELQNLAARPTSLGMVMTLGDVLFDVGKATLKPGAQRSLDRLAEFLQKYPERKVRIEGFTDDTGSAEANHELSRQRADAVRSELVRRGISGDRVETVGYGPAFPIASNGTAAGRQQNRRVEVVISDESGNVGKR